MFDPNFSVTLTVFRGRAFQGCEANLTFFVGVPTPNPFLGQKIVVKGLYLLPR